MKKEQLPQSRLRSRTAWLSVFALVGFLLGNYGLYDAIGLTNETYQMLVDLLLGVMGAFGIFNNPTDKNNY